MDSDGPLSSKSEHVIQNVAGCGPFQVVLVFSMAVVTNLATASTLLFMTFGIYNPGWRCLDPNASDTANGQSHVTDLYRSTKDSNDDDSLHPFTGEYIQNNCSLFESCRRIEFSPGTSTIVSEWGLLCDDAWIPNIIISLQMIGHLVGCLYAGHVADAFGRKKAIYISQVFLAIFNIISIFSPSWQVFAALRFLIGLAVACIASGYYVYVSEFVTIKWRGPLANIPFWSVLCGVFAVTCMLLKDWRHILIAISGFAVIGILPALWLPESLRWLEVKNKTSEFEQAATKIAKMNGKTLPALDDITVTADDAKKYNIFHLFKRRCRKYTLLISVPWFSVDLINYAISFGVSTLSGDFYVNMIIMNFMESPLSFIFANLPNVIGRRKASILFAGGSGMCLVTAACFYQFTTGGTNTTGVLVLVLTGKSINGIFDGFLQVYTAEIYPTVVRGLGASWGSILSKIGGITAPFLIPNQHNSVFICYIVMGILALISCVMISQLPETKGRVLKETYEEIAGTNNEKQERERLLDVN